MPAGERASVPMTHGAIASHFSPKLKKKRNRSRAAAMAMAARRALEEREAVRGSERRKREREVTLDVCFLALSWCGGTVKIYHGTLDHYREKCLPEKPTQF
jgi:hypothetical protein